MWLALFQVGFHLRKLTSSPHITLETELEFLMLVTHNLTFEYVRHKDSTRTTALVLSLLCMLTATYCTRAVQSCGTLKFYSPRYRGFKKNNLTYLLTDRFPLLCECLLSRSRARDPVPAVLRENAIANSNGPVIEKAIRKHAPR